MNRLPSISYLKLLRALQRAGFVVVRQRGSHIRLQKRLGDKVVKLTIPAHKTIKRSTLFRIIKASQLEINEFIKLI